MALAGFEPAISEREWLQTYALDRNGRCDRQPVR